MFTTLRDSGYNSPCSDMSPSTSFHLPYLQLRDSKISPSKTFRKALHFESQPVRYDAATQTEIWYVDPVSRNISACLINLCDQFDREFYPKKNASTSCLLDLVLRLFF